MTFATTKTLIVLTILWAVALFGIDYAKNPKGADSLFAPKQMGMSSNEGKPVIKLWLNHLCCTSCLSEVTKALAKVSSVKVKSKPLPTEEQADQSDMEGTKPKDYGGEIELEFTDLRQVDFMAITRALRESGLVADRMLISGLQHYRLTAELKHLCCGLCATGVKEGLEITRGLKSQNHFKWLDSFQVSRKDKLVIAHARYDAVADVTELIHGLNQVGFEPVAIFAAVDKEGAAGADGH
jgi:copper chaperone CopZ